MPTRISQFALLVDDYDAAINFFADVGFKCVEDANLAGDKRWVRIALPGSTTEILLARAVGDQKSAIGNQGGGRVWLFLETEDFDTDLARLVKAGATVEGGPRDEPYGRVVVWRDPWGNRWDLIQYARSDRGGTDQTFG